MINHTNYMLHAINLAKKGKFKNKHHLLVGCVIVKNNKIIGEGYYNSAKNNNHAEINAINSAPISIENSSVYITLEPCYHTGKTPPCVDALIKNKVKEVIIPFKDPNPLVNGKSILKLNKAGIKVTTGILPNLCYDLNEEFLYFHLTGLPLLTLKWASSLDGKLCTSTYNSKWISSEKARIMAHKIRSQNKAILIGANTLLLDNPLLNVRYNIKCYQNPIRIVLTNTNNINENALLWNDHSLENWLLLPHNCINYNNIQNLSKKGVKIIPLYVNKNGIINPINVLEVLAKKGVSSLLIEGGAKTLGFFLENRLANKIELFLAPLILGGNITPANFINKQFEEVKNSESFKITNHKILEDTIWLTLLNKQYLINKQNYINSLQK